MSSLITCYPLPSFVVQPAGLGGLGWAGLAWTGLAWTKAFGKRNELQFPSPHSSRPLYTQH